MERKITGTTGYNIHRADCTVESGKHGGGGIIAYTKDHIDCYHLP